jgi:VanZ family protein
LKAWLPPVAWMGVIFFFSSRPMPPGTETIPDWLSHGGAWALLCVLMARALDVSRVPHVAVLAFVASVSYGIFDEIHQSYVPSRTPDAMDVVKDAGGAALGLLAWQVRLRRLFHSEVT